MSNSIIPNYARVIESRAERRERIATALAAGMLAAEAQGAAATSNNPWLSDDEVADRSVNFADALMAELDRREAADRSEQ